MLYGHPGRLVQIEIEKEQANHQVLMAGDKLRDCFDGISFYQFYLGDMPQEAGAVVDSGKLAQLVKIIRRSLNPLKRSFRLPG